ncbi:MAG: ribose 5-phosphate isomerase B [Candidatus Marinimicrobia bacterium]|nr:ribose 5-phosphate isomerase B [Candidatus Neomarinimicrobiota bacterium]|tara:strand:- start:199 stop:627 length:429 start_codon:yes stop_codon:yes gene_type:complete
MKIAIGSDHAAYKEKQILINYLENRGLTVLDFGTDSEDSVDYPIFGQKVAKSVLNEIANKGIIICGTGIGISIAANRFKGIRAALCTSESHAEMSRKHNDSNILALGSRTTNIDLLKKIVKVWLETDFEAGRHINRLNMLDE